jgi:hypothetical protein
MVDNPDLNRSLEPINQPVMPFSMEENQLIENLIKVELGTSEVIKVPEPVMLSLIHVSSDLVGNQLFGRQQAPQRNICIIFHF